MNHDWLNEDRLARAQYRSGQIKLQEQFENWSEYLDKACGVAASYGINLTVEDAEAAIECLYELNPQQCWNLLCCDFEPEDHDALIRGILSERYPYLQIPISIGKHISMSLQVQFKKRRSPLPWHQIEDTIAFYLMT